MFSLLVVNKCIFCYKKIIVWHESVRTKTHRICTKFDVLEINFLQNPRLLKMLKGICTLLYLDAVELFFMKFTTLSGNIPQFK